MKAPQLSIAIGTVCRARRLPCTAIAQELIHYVGPDVMRAYSEEYPKGHAELRALASASGGDTEYRRDVMIEAIDLLQKIAPPPAYHRLGFHHETGDLVVEFDEGEAEMASAEGTLIASTDLPTAPKHVVTRSHDGKLTLWRIRHTFEEVAPIPSEFAPKVFN